MQRVKTTMTRDSGNPHISDMAFGVFAIMMAVGILIGWQMGRKRW